MPCCKVQRHISERRTDDGGTYGMFIGHGRSALSDCGSLSNRLARIDTERSLCPICHAWVLEASCLSDFGVVSCNWFQCKKILDQCSKQSPHTRHTKTTCDQRSLEASLNVVGASVCVWWTCHAFPRIALRRPEWTRKTLAL